MSRPGRAQLTVLRQTPVGDYALGDKDAADTLGDLAFGLRTLYYPYLCRHLPTYDGCFLNTPTVYLRARIETTGELGPYQECKPPPANASAPFVCSPQFWGCPPCPARTERMVGWQNVSTLDGKPGPLSPPCAAP